jgi:hypothetical protein
MEPDFRFPLDEKAPRGLRWWWFRFCARQVCRIIAVFRGTYQFGGWDGALKKHYSLVDADSSQLIHWILFSVGYSCCPADVMRRCGIFAERKDGSTLEVRDEKPDNPSAISAWIKSISGGEPS